MMYVQTYHFLSIKLKVTCAFTASRSTGVIHRTALRENVIENEFFQLFPWIHDSVSRSAVEWNPQGQQWQGRLKTPDQACESKI